MTDTGVPDGIKVDAWGNVWTGMGDGVACYSPGAPRPSPLLSLQFTRIWCSAVCYLPLLES